MDKNHTISSASDIDRMLSRMAYEILEIHKGVENLALVGIQTRGIYLAKRIQSRIQEIENVEVPVGKIDITMYRDDWTRIGDHPVVKETDISFSIDGKQIVLIDDVLFTGRTVRAAMDAITDFGRPDRIELAVLVDRGYRELPIQADFIGKLIETKQSETVNVLLSECDDKDTIFVVE